MVLQATFITTEKQDIENISHLLMSGISDIFLKDPANPLIVSINGSWKGGKSLISDTATGYFSRNRNSEVITYTGTEHADDNITLLFNNTPMDITFYNIQWGSKPPTRTHGGISFETNHIPTSNRKISPDIDIWIESTVREADSDGHDRNLMQLSNESRLSRLNKKNRNAFNALSYNQPNPHQDWTRLIEITIRNTQLAEHPEFQKVLQTLPFKEKINFGHNADRNLLKRTLSYALNGETDSLPIYKSELLTHNENMQLSPS